MRGPLPDNQEGRDGGPIIPLLVPPFSEFLALRVQELERERVRLMKRVYRLEVSRDMWMARSVGHERGERMRRAAHTGGRRAA